MRARNTLGTLALAFIISLLALTASAQAQAKPVWKLNAAAEPTHLISGTSGKGHLFLRATNVGAAATSGTITFTDTLPLGISVAAVDAVLIDPGVPSFDCTTTAQSVSCESDDPLPAGYLAWLDITVNVSASEGAHLTNEAEVSGGGATDSAKASTPITVSNTPPEFDFLP